MASDLYSLGYSIIKKNLAYVPSGDLGKLAKCLIKKSIIGLHDGDIGKSGKAIINKNLVSVSTNTDWGKFAYSIVNRDIRYIPSGDLVMSHQLMGVEQHLLQEHLALPFALVEEALPCSSLYGVLKPPQEEQQGLQ